MNDLHAFYGENPLEGGDVTDAERALAILDAAQQWADLHGIGTMVSIEAGEDEQFLVYVDVSGGAG